MRIIAPMLFLSCGLLACQTGGDLGGGDPGWELDDDPFSVPESNFDTGGGGTDSDELRSDTIVVDSATCDESDDDVPQTLSATVSGTSVTLVHEGIGTWCSADFTVAASIYTNGYVDIQYTDGSGTTAETAECWCHWTVSYTVDDLTPGTWTASALDDSATFTIE